MFQRCIVAAMLLMLFAPAAALALDQPSGVIVTDEKLKGEKEYHQIQVQAFENLRYEFRCVYQELERSLPIEQIASIEHTGSKNLGASAILTQLPSIERATVTMKDGQVLEVEIQPGHNPFEVLIDGGDGKLSFLFHDELTGQNRRGSMHYDKIRKLIFQ